MDIRDSRRITGPNIVWARTGAMLELYEPSERLDAFLPIWRAQMRRILTAIGWQQQAAAMRRFSGGAHLAVSAPPDQNYAATYIVELAASMTAFVLGWAPAVNFDREIARLADIIGEDANPRLCGLQEQADQYGVTLLRGEGQVSLGMGRHAQSWPLGDLPRPDRVAWDSIRDIPTALVTGTNGKSTTVRLVAAMAEAAGLAAGSSSSDWVRHGQTILGRGDYSGPGGARLLLRQPGLDFAVMEIARGGLLRRGLPVARAQAALITNIAADHLGDFGVLSLEDLTDAKFVVSHAVQEKGTLILNADDPILRRRGADYSGKLAWFSLALDPWLRAWLAAGGAAGFVDKEWMVLQAGNEAPRRILPVTDLPIGFNGTASYNIANALAAALLASVMGIPDQAIARALRNFTSNADQNPGRANLFRFGDVLAILDFAHNPHGVAAVVAFAKTLRASRRLVILGQAGDRSDQDIADMTRAALDFAPDRVIVKEMEIALRGREKGEIPGLIIDTLTEEGFDRDQIVEAGSDFDSVRQALDWARQGDLLLLLVHRDRQRIIDWLQNLERQGWKPGQELPSSFSVTEPR